MRRLHRSPALPAPRRVRKILLAPAILAAALAAEPDSLSQPGKLPRVGPNVRMNGAQLPEPNGLLGRAAGAVAADAEGKVVVAAWETAQGACGPPSGFPCTPPAAPGQTAVGYSLDGGRTWVDAGPPPAIEGVITAGHPWLDRGGAGTFYLVSRGRRLDNGYLTGVVFHRAEVADGRLVWKSGQVFRGAKPGDILRSSSVTAAKDGSGVVWVALSNVREQCDYPSRGTGQIEVVQSADHGLTWSERKVLGPDDLAVTPDPKDPRCGEKGAVQVGPSMALGPGGEVYALWPFGPVFYDYFPHPYFPPVFPTSQTASIRFARSLDGGRTWSPGRDVGTLSSLRDLPPVGFSKDNLIDYVRIAVALDGPHRGRVYVTYPSALVPVSDLPATDQMLVSSQVHLLYSDDRGETWSRPVPLAPAPPPSGLKRFWPTVAVQPGGTVDVVYAESQERQATADPHDVECAVGLPTGFLRTGEASSLVDLYRVQSTDGGKTFGAPLRITSATSNWCTAQYDPGGFLFANFGDYLGVFPGRGRTLAVWTDARNGVPDAYFATIEDPGAAAGASAPAAPENHGTQ